MTSTRQLAARLVFAAVLLGGLLGLGLAVSSPELEWRFVTMAALAFASGTLVTGISGTHSRNGDDALQIPLAHPVLFAASLGLGPAAAALPGACCGIARLILGPPHKRPVSEVLYIALKPAAVCAAASLAYIVAGGSVLNPQAADSAYAVVVAALVYLSSNTVLAGVIDTLYGREAGAVPRVSLLAVTWFTCLMAGYALAVLFTFAPTYVLLAPTLALGLTRLTLREPAAGDLPKAGPETMTTADADDSNESTEFLDPLTGLANQRYLSMFMNREISRSERTGSPLSLAVFELGGFDKTSNDADRAAMESALRNMGRQLKSGLRDYDLVARYAAGRLMLVLPELPSDAALEVTERLHESIMALKVGGKPISAAAGMATFPVDGATAEDLINSCHRALNRGKFEGGNGVYSIQNLAKAS